MNTTHIGVDLAKTVFELAVSTTPGRVDQRRRVSRTGFPRFFVNRPPARVVMEACGAAHHWARTLQRIGRRPAPGIWAGSPSAGIGTSACC